jgi:acetate kinase
LWNIPQIAVFDTAFHQNMEKENFLYPIPYKYYQKYKIRKYWFHGISHDYVSKSACKILNLNIKKQKIISCHIWNGASITAIKNWKVIDTSMWMTPLAWLMMWTRCWDIDPAIIEFISKKDYITTEEIGIILNEKSWLLWISETSSDMREILEWENKWDEMSKLAINMYINRIIKYIWSYIALIWWLDILIFTAWIWENSRIIRRKIIKKLWYFNIKLDNKNKKNTWTEWIISDKNSKVKVMVIPTKEEYMIAMETFNILKK